MMDLRFCNDHASFVSAGADIVASELGARPAPVIALPTGRTPEGLYAELIRRQAAGTLDLGRGRYVNLDEYAGLAASHPSSFAHFLQSRLLVPAGIPVANVRLLRGDAPDLGAECRACDDALAACGGIDLAILGLGANGHIAFNEPGAPWDGTTWVADLTAETRAATGGELSTVLPARGITLGLATLSQARRILLLAAGLPKARALAALRTGVPTREWPVTRLLGHPGLTVLVSPELAASVAPVSAAG